MQAIKFLHVSYYIELVYCVVNKTNNEIAKTFSEEFSYLTEQLEKYNSNDTEHCLKKLRRKYSITSTKERNSIFESECKPSQDIHFSKIRSKPTCD